MTEINDTEFWSATEHLKLIHQWARASYVAPYALLVAILPRVIATTGPHVMLPGPPAPASLNMGVVLVGRSGAGKGVTDKLSRIVWPAKIHEEGLGSGQGIAELFKEQKNPEDRIDRALITVSEIDHLTALNAGQGNNTRAAVKAALTGDRLGSKGASTATTRAVPADSYRLCLSISAQFGHCGVLLDDVSGGTPQRQLWMLVTDPDMPKELGSAPDRVLDIALPSWAQTGDQVLIQYGTPEIREYINAGLWDSGRGAVEAIDGHRTLTRLKVAAAFAILDHRMVVSALDWELSEHIMVKSDGTRNSVLEYDRQAARAKIRDRAISRAVGEEFIDQRRLDVVKRRVLKVLAEGRTARRNLTSRMGKREYRELLDSALAELAGEGEVSVIEGNQGGTQFELNREFSAEPKFSTQNSRSGALNREFSTEPDATVTDLDSRRSPETERPKLSCGDWLAEYVDSLRAAGETEVTSFALHAAGRANGYGAPNISTYIKRSPELTFVRRVGQSTVWAIEPEEATS